MDPPEEKETPAKVLDNIRSTISCLQRLESSIIKEEEERQSHQPPSVSSRGTQTEEPVGAKPDVSYTRQSKMVAQYQQLPGGGTIFRQVVSEVVSKKVTTLGGPSTSNETRQRFMPLPRQSASFSPIVEPPQAPTSPISPGPVNETSMPFAELTNPTTVMRTTTCFTQTSSNSNSQIRVPQFLISNRRSLSQTSNVTSFESSDSGLASGESFEVYSPEPMLTSGLQSGVPSSAHSQFPSVETCAGQAVRQSVTGSVGTTSSTMTDSEMARLLQPTSTTLGSSQRKRQKLPKTAEVLAQNYKRIETSSVGATLEQLKTLQLQRKSFGSEVVVAAEGGEGRSGQICDSTASSSTQQSVFTWPQVPPVPQASPQLLVDSVRKGQFRRQESIAICSPQTLPTCARQEPNQHGTCGFASCLICGPLLLKQQLQWQRSSRSNSMPDQGQTLVDPMLNLSRRASAPVTVPSGVIGPPNVAGTSSSVHRRGSSNQVFAGMASLTASQSGQVYHQQIHHQQIQQIQHHQVGGMQSQTIYYNSPPQHQGVPSSMSMAAMPTNTTFTQASSGIVMNQPHSTSLFQPHQHQYQAAPTSSQHSFSQTNQSVQAGPSGPGGPSSNQQSIQLPYSATGCNQSQSAQADPSGPGGPSTSESCAFTLPCIISGCHQVLASQALLSEHMQVTHGTGSYWCCGASYIISPFLREHIQRRHRSAPVCQACGQIFLQTKAVWEHITKLQCEQMKIANQTTAASGTGTDRFVRGQWTGADQTRHAQLQHQRFNRYTPYQGPSGGANWPPTSGV